MRPRFPEDMEQEMNTMSMDPPFTVEIAIMNGSGERKMLVKYEGLSREALTEMEEVIGGSLISLGKSKL